MRATQGRSHLQVPEWRLKTALFALGAIEEAPLAAIDLPFKALAWEDAQGKVWLMLALFLDHWAAEWHLPGA